MSTTVTLIRHGDYRVGDAVHGAPAPDRGLSALGRRQAQALAERLLRSGEMAADGLFCSSMARARETAEILAPALGLQPVALVALREWDSGSDRLGPSHFLRLLRALVPAQRAAHRFHPACETLGEFTQRVSAVLSDLLQRYDGRSVVIVAHGGIVEVAFAHFIGLPFGPMTAGAYPAAGHTSITRWQRDDGDPEWVLERSNDTHHLAGLDHETGFDTPAGAEP